MRNVRQLIILGVAFVFAVVLILLFQEPHTPRNNHADAIITCIRQGDVQGLRVILANYPAGLWDRIEDSISFVHLAVEESASESIPLLIEYNFNIEAKDNTGRTPLFVAAYEGKFSCAEILIANGANVNAQNMIQMTPLHAAVVAGNISMSKLLLENRANPSMKMKTGQTALDLAIDKGDINMIELIRSWQVADSL